MGNLSLIGTICWVVCAALGLLFLFKTWNGMSPSGVVYKGLASFSVVGYAFVLIFLSGSQSEAAVIFAIGLILVSIGDVLIGIVQAREGGETSAIARDVEGLDKGNPGSAVWIGLVGVTFIVSYFLQMVAFIKGLSTRADATDYVIPFLMFFLLPPIFTAIGGLLAQFRIPEVMPNIFVIGVFYILLTSALFASSAVFSFAMFQEDQNHAAFVLVGSILFFLSTLFVLLRYSNPERFENNATKGFSRVITFFGRMMLAGCAFML